MGAKNEYVALFNSLFSPFVECAGLLLILFQSSVPSLAVAFNFFDCSMFPLIFTLLSTSFVTTNDSALPVSVAPEKARRIVFLL